jgi:hypothetical protein
MRPEYEERDLALSRVGCPSHTGNSPFWWIPHWTSPVETGRESSSSALFSPGDGCIVLQSIGPKAGWKMEGGLRLAIPGRRRSNRGEVRRGFEETERYDISTDN